MRWPRDTREALDAFYGEHDISETTHLPTAVWEARNLTIIRPPFPFRLSFARGTVVHRMRCHVKVAESLLAIYAAVWAHYGRDLEAVRATGFDLFGGCYNYRPIAGGKGRLSTHAWGVSVDHAPARNPLGKAWKDDGIMMPSAIIEIFAAEGWESGAKWNRPDAMHFQAARTR